MLVGPHLNVNMNFKRRTLVGKYCVLKLTKELLEQFSQKQYKEQILPKTTIRTKLALILLRIHYS